MNDRSEHSSSHLAAKLGELASRGGEGCGKSGSHS